MLPDLLIVRVRFALERLGLIDEAGVEIALDP